MAVNSMRYHSLLYCCLFVGGVPAWAQQSSETPVETSPDTEQRARRPGRGEDRMLGMVPLLKIETVREELGIDDQQSKALETVTLEVRDDFGKQIAAFLQSFRGLSQEERRAKRRDNREEIIGIHRKVNQRLKGVLGDSKFQRLEEIEVQRLVRTSGIGALASQDIAAALDLTDDQKQQLRQQAEDSQGQRNTLSLDEVRAQVKEVLTEEQMAKLETLFGADFDLPQELLERGRGRRFGRGRRARAANRLTDTAQEGEGR